MSILSHHKVSSFMTSTFPFLHLKKCRIFCFLLQIFYIFLYENTDEYGRISQEKLAELSGTSASMIANLEATNVMQTMSIVLLRKIALALNIPLYAFFLEKPIKNPPINPFE